jgi:hypothetical protein
MKIYYVEFTGNGKDQWEEFEGSTPGHAFAKAKRAHPTAVLKGSVLQGRDFRHAALRNQDMPTMPSTDDAVQEVMPFYAEALSRRKV